MPTNPEDYLGFQIPQIPLDENRKWVAPLFSAIVDGGGDITGYLPLKVINQGDGTAVLEVSMGTTPDINIGDVNILDTTDTRIDPSTKQKQDEIISELQDIETAILGITPNDPIGLKNTSANPIDPATEPKQDSIIAELQSIDAKDFATETTLASIDTSIDTPLSTRASESTLSDVLTTAQNIDSRFQSIVSTVNSTATPLGSGATFTGIAEEVTNASVVSILVFADQDSATDGLKVQWSSNATNWDDDDLFTISANNGKFYTFAPEARYFRVVYTNGAIAQSVFRLQTIFKSVYTKPSSHRVGESISQEDDAELVKAVLTGATDGTFINVLATPEGRLKVSASLEFENFADLGQAFVYSAPKTNFSSSGVEAPFVYVKNPLASGFVLKIRNLLEGVLSTNKPTTFRVYVDPTVTANGTSRTPINKRVGNATTPVAQVFTEPTVSAFGNRVNNSIVVAGVFAIEEASTLQLLENHSLLFTVEPSVNNTECTATLDWAEVEA